MFHDANHDIRTPTHELTIARDVLRSRRRIAAQPPGWAVSYIGLNSSRGVGADGRGAEIREDPTKAPPSNPEGPGAVGEREADDPDDRLVVKLAAIEAVLARSETARAAARVPGAPRAQEKDPLVYDLDWDEDARIGEWRVVLAETEGMPPVLRAIVLLDAWNVLQVLDHAPWLGRLLAASILREAGVATAAHLAAANLGLRSIPVDRRRHPHRETRLLALVNGSPNDLLPAHENPQTKQT